MNCSEAGGFRRILLRCGKKAGLAISLYNNILHFTFHQLRFESIARDSLLFPPGKAANILRGALGFQRIAAIPDCTDAKGCDSNPTKGRTRA
ncbi:hypothetical protein SBA4_4120009 [Candidatus Sulfopaludibacter sp. SbA4]|nr:hypothetical protein SBA4_4120009 [Candidatus Sulfopaludibacter sp. SbA4]